jgi:hypothetical protein
MNQGDKSPKHVAEEYSVGNRLRKLGAKVGNITPVSVARFSGEFVEMGMKKKTE